MTQNLPASNVFRHRHLLKILMLNRYCDWIIASVQEYFLQWTQGCGGRIKHITAVLLYLIIGT